MLLFFCKIIQKLNYILQKIGNSLKVGYYYNISKHRFIIKSPYSLGKKFTVTSDQTGTAFTINKNFQVRNNFNIIMANKGNLFIGENCFFNNNCSVNCLGKIEIGNNNQFGEVVLIYDHNHVYADNKQLIKDQGYNTGTVKIGNNCWIGSNVVILKDVEIGDNVVIGAGCIIFKSIPSNSIVTNYQNLAISTHTSNG